MTIFVNRDNHESEMSTQTEVRLKFLFDIKNKVSEVDWSSFKPSVAELIYAFSICHALDENIFIIHGGVLVASEVVTIPQPR